MGRTTLKQQIATPEQQVAVVEHDGGVAVEAIQALSLALQSVGQANGKGA